MNLLNGMKTIINNFSWVFLGNLSNSLFLWSILVVMAKTEGPELVGSYAFALLINAPVFMFLDMQLKNVYLTKEGINKKNLITYRLHTVICALIYSIIVSFLFPQYSTLIILVGLIKTIDLIIDFNIGVFQDTFQFQKSGLGLFLKALFSFGGYCIGIYVFSSITVGLLLIILMKILNLIFYDYRYLKLDNMFLLSNTQDLLINFKKYYPLGFVLLLLSLNANVPRFFIEHNLGVYELGVYAALAYFMASGRTVYNSLIESYFPVLRNHFNLQKSKYYSSVNLVIILIFFLCLLGSIVGYLFGDQLIILFYSEEYLEMNVFYVLLLALFVYFFAKLIDLLLILYSAYNFNMYSLCFSFSLNILSIGYFIDQFGLVGAALSFLFAMLAYLVANIIFLRKCSRKTI